jgi:hypothetical protein
MILGYVSKRNGVVLLYGSFYISIFMLTCLALVLASLVPSLEGFELVIDDRVVNCFLTTLHMPRDFLLGLSRLVEPEYFSNVDITKMLPLALASPVLVMVLCGRVEFGGE